MRWLTDLAFRLRAVMARRTAEEELEAEMAFHLDMETKKLARAGLSELEAHREARTRFGHMGRQKEATRRSWGVAAADDVRADVRLVLRQLRRNPGFACGAILTLALGIGATTAIFSILDQTLLRRPPVLEPDRLVAVYTSCRTGFTKCSSSYPDYEDYRRHATALTDLAAFSSVPLSVGDGETARLATGFVVTGNFFDLLGVRPFLGRLIEPSDFAQGAGQVAVLSHSLWLSAFGGDSGIMGRTIRLNEATFTVLGVAARGFRGLSLSVTGDVWIPMVNGPALGPGVGSASNAEAPGDRGNRWIGTLIGRLAPGATVEQLRSQMALLAAQLAAQYPDERAAADGVRGITVDGLDGYILPPGSESQLRRFVFLLLSVAGLTLLMATTNLANLLLARATARHREMAIRVAVGAGTSRVVRQLLVESLVLGLLGGTAGLVAALAFVRSLSAYQLPGAVSIGGLDISLDARMLAVTAALSLLTAVTFGLVPALRSARPDLVPALKSDAPASSGRSTGLRRALVGVQVALCVILLVGSGLFIRTLQNSLASDLGFEPRGTVVSRYSLALLRYSDDRGIGFMNAALERVRSFPETRVASAATLVPFQNGGFRGTFFQVDGYAPVPDEELRADYVLVAPAFFDAIGARMSEGRDFDGGDRTGSRLVAIVNRHMANRYWPGRSAIGGSVRLASGQVFEVVGVTENITWRSAGEESTPFIFLPVAQHPRFANDFMTIIVRGNASPQRMLPLLERAVHESEPALSLTSLRSLSEQVGGALLPQRMGMTLLSLFGALALVLAAVGVYGVLSYSVTRRARDIAVRLALGSSRGRAMQSVFGEMAPPVVLGILAGVAVAVGLSRFIRSLLFGVSPTDGATLGSTVSLVLLVAIAAAFIPARRAARMDPARVLRTE